MNHDSRRLPLAGLGLALCLSLLCREVRAEGDAYVVDPEHSSVAIHVGRAGLFKFAGHEHLVLAPRFEGEIQADPGDLSRSSVRLTFDPADLVVSEEGEASGDAPKVQERMIGPDVLDRARFPRIVFRSTAVGVRSASHGSYQLRVTGDLGLHGATRSIAVPVEVDVSGDTITARGRFGLRQTDYDIKPVSVAGVVKVKDEVSIEFTLLATKAPRPPVGDTKTPAH